MCFFRPDIGVSLSKSMSDDSSDMAPGSDAAAAGDTWKASNVSQKAHGAEEAATSQPKGGQPLCHLCQRAEFLSGNLS